MMQTIRDFYIGGDRYLYDFTHCTSSKGWAQLDDGQDAWYYGQWANPFKLWYVSFIEGDFTMQRAETEEEFIELIRSVAKMDSFKGIDGMCNDALIKRFTELGLGDLLH
jgi:hypothetical protein